MPSKISIYPFITFAVVIHLTLWLVFFKSEPTFVIPKQDGQGFSVTLTQHTIEIQAQKLAPKKRMSNNIQTVRKNKPNSFTEQKISSKDINKQVQHKEKNIIASQNNKQINSQTKIIGTIQKQLKHSFYYPRIARAKNWQGTVILSINIEKTGTITNVSISKSSGHTILDNAALKSMNNIKQKNFLMHLVSQHQTIQLPIVYQLTTG